MDPVTISAVAAVAAIATAVGNGVASAAGKDAYEAVKQVISNRFTAAEPALLEIESAPTLTATRNALAMRLEEVGAYRDDEFREKVQVLLGALTVLQSEPAAAPLFDFDKLEVAGHFKITDVSALATLLKAGQANFKSDVTISGVRQSRGDPEKH